MKKLIFIFLFLLFTVKAEATLIERYFDYEANSTVTDVNLDGNINNIINVVNGDLDNTNIRTSTHRLYELLGSVPAAGTQGRIVYNTVENTLNFDTGSSWFTSPTYTGTAASGEILYYDGTNWARTSGATPAIKITVASGNVGIGLTNPIAPLEVQGNLIADTGTFTTLTTTTVDGNITVAGNITANTGTFSTLQFGTQTNTLPSGTAPSGSLLVNNGSGTISWGAGRQVFTSDGNFLAPAGVTMVYVTMVGGGGAGGYDRGGGAGGGALIVNYPYAVTPGNTYAVDVGAAGVGGTVGTPAGTAGAKSSFDGYVDTSSLYANGGGGGAGAAGAAGAGGTYQTATSGDTYGTIIPISGGAGGASSGNTGGAGGGSAWGRGGNGGASGIAGTAGQNYGGGGGGGGNGANGGAGAAGLVIVEY